jgi:hypothetical protein
MAPSTLAQWFSAFGTIAAVVLVLFKDLLLAWIRRARLVASCTNKSPWTARVPYTVTRIADGAILWSGNAFWVRVRVENVGRTRAEKVQVYASSLARQGADGKFENIPSFLPLNMKWANLPSGWQGAILDGISPKMAAFCDAVAICDPANPQWSKPEGTPPNTTVGQLQLEAFIGQEMLPPGTYKVELRIAAANVKPINKILIFKHTGSWLPDEVEMRRDCLGVSME